MSTGSINIQCWKCGAELTGIILPFSRLEECSRCSSDLHVCKGCKNYSTSLTSACNEDRADFVSEKEKANFCDFFAANSNAFKGSNSEKEEAARAKLAELFGDTIESKSEGSIQASNTQQSEAEKALAELKRLFGEE